MARVARYGVAFGAAAFIAAASGSVWAGHDYEEPVDFIPQEKVRQLVEIGEDVIFIDIRSAEEFGKGHLPGAKSIPIDVLGHRWQEIPKDGRVVLYCACPPGQKDEIFAFTLMFQEKYRNVQVLEDGYEAWVKRGYPTEAASR